MESIKRVVPLLITILLSSTLIMCGGGGGGGNGDTDATTLQVTSISLSSGTLSPAFDAGTTAYTATVANDTASVDVTVATDPSDATVTINGGSNETVTLSEGSNGITVVATSGAQSKTYTVTVTREAAAGAATLTALSLTAGGSALVLSPAFASGTNSYATANVAADIDEVEVSATSSDGTVTGDGTVSLAYGSNTVTVTAGGTAGLTQNYTITIVRNSPDMELDSLSLAAGGSGVTLSPAFASGTTSYSATVGWQVDSVTVNYTVDSYYSSSVTVSGNTGLSVGANVVTVVIAKDSSTATYTITVTKESEPVLAVTGLSVTAGGSAVDISPTFSSSGTAYTASVASDVTSAVIAATVSPSDATVTGTGVLTLAEGNNTATINITSGTQSATYTVMVYRAHDYSDEDDGTFDTDDISIKSLEILRNANGDDWTVSYSPDFARDQYVYTASVPAGTTEVTVKAKKQGGSVSDGNCNFVVNGTSQSFDENETLSGLVSGLNTIEIVVRKDDWGTIIATRTYTILLTVLEQTWDCTDCMDMDYTFDTCSSSSASYAGNYTLNQQTHREYDYMQGMGYVGGQVNICEDFTDFLAGGMMGTESVIPASGEIVSEDTFSNGEYFTVKWYSYDECYENAYDSLNGILGLVGGLLPSYFDVNQVMNYDFYGYSKMQVVGTLNDTDFPGIPVTDDPSTDDVNESVDGQFCIIHFKDMPTQAEAEAIPFFTTNAQIAAIIDFYVKYSPDNTDESYDELSDAPSGFDNVRKIYFITPNAK